MNMNTKSGIIMIVAFSLIGTILGFTFAMGLKGSVELNLDTAELSKIDYVHKVACGSDSMGLTLNCGDKVYSRILENEEKLEIGSIYIYRSSNHTIIHRLVKCLDEECSMTIFKGDNNRVAEIVNRSEILYKVIKIEYG
jgi:hypothetical protein